VAAKPVEVRHSPATVTIARISLAMEVRTPTPQWLLNLREKGAGTAMRSTG